MKKLLILALPLFLFACEERKSAPAQSNAQSTSTAATKEEPKPEPKAEPKEVVIADTDLSTPAEFEAEAEKAITVRNYKTELTALEAEVNKE